MSLVLSLVALAAWMISLGAIRGVSDVFVGMTNRRITGIGYRSHEIEGDAESLGAAAALASRLLELHTLLNERG
ncbi:MAG: hypothetical protein JXE06_07705 [Coriobacteriia bacterium]|nr:hypothetical protein [Coriobacteriia bacterium]MBN2822292.1 hypothetical protein [Coriobacteriia bacterium]